MVRFSFLLLPLESIRRDIKVNIKRKVIICVPNKLFWGEYYKKFSLPTVFEMVSDVASLGMRVWSVSHYI